AQRASGKREGGALAWGRRKVEDALANVVGARLIADVTEIFADLTTVRTRFAALARDAEQLLLGTATRFVIVAAPTGAARADALYLMRRLDRLAREPVALVLNRADLTEFSWARALRADATLSPALRAALAQLEAERMARTTAADRMAAD